MAKPLGPVALVSAACFSLTLGCGGSDATGIQAVAGATGTAGSAPSGTAGASSGTSGSGNTAAGAPGANAGAGNSSAGDGNGTGGNGSAGSNAAAGSGGASGVAGAAGAAGAGGGSTVTTGHVRIGKSSGCGKAPPAADSSTKFVKHEIHINGLDPVYLTGGMYYKNSGSYDFSFRPYGVELPTNYDPTKPYPIVFGGGGCGGDATNFAGNPNGSFDMAPKTASVIRVGLAYVTTCFSDGGPDIGNRPDTPDEPYFRAIMAEAEANYCIDLSQAFMGGYSSGGWESYMLGCATSDLVRGIGAEEGGQRAMHPACKNPVAAVLVAGEADTENPIGPLTLDSDAGKRLGSYGSGPSRDEILTRNGCTGTATAPADAMYPACVKYTGCPAAYPVIWCALPGVGHNDSTYNGVNYSPGTMWNVLSALPPPQ